MARSEFRTVRTIVIAPYLRGRTANGSGGPGQRNIDARLKESVGLARAIALDVVDSVAVPLTSLRPPTLLGSGKVKELSEKIAAESVELVVIDHALSPVQQRNLERAWEVKVIDRTGLILEIFGERAQTREGRLQVELAHLNYQKSRLVRSWTHLERQRGGFGFLGGPGETQIEADRRQIRERIGRIEPELAGVVRTRRLQRANRRRVPHPVVALVGYTNAGKTTLFNALTGSEGVAADFLFATLDPTLRRARLPHGADVIISDTVGFVSYLPTDLVAAFRATLEEVVEADLILHVRDIAHPDTAAQAEDVASVLSQLSIDVQLSTNVIEVWNKTDLLGGVVPSTDVGGTDGTRRPVAVSALKGEGIDQLLAIVEDALHERRTVMSVHLGGERLAELHRAYALGEVLDRTTCGDGSTDLRVRVSGKSLDRFLEAFPEAVLENREDAPALARSA